MIVDFGWIDRFQTILSTFTPHPQPRTFVSSRADSYSNHQRFLICIQHRHQIKEIQGGMITHAEKLKRMLIDCEDADAFLWTALTIRSMNLPHEIRILTTWDCNQWHSSFAAHGKIPNPYPCIPGLTNREATKKDATQCTSRKVTQETTNNQSITIQGTLGKTQGMLDSHIIQ